MEKRYLKFYFEWVEDGVLPHGNGLCQLFNGDEFFDLIDPEFGDMNSYWGCDDYERGSNYRSETANVFGPLRQNIVLLMAAMNGEL